MFSKERKSLMSHEVMVLHIIISSLYASLLILPSLMLCCQTEFVNQVRKQAVKFNYPPYPDFQYVAL